MTIQQLRKEISVTGWHIGIDGISINYMRSKNSQNSVNKTLYLNPLNSARHLDDIGTIDSWSGDPLLVMKNENTTTFHWDDFVRNFHLSQWDAITIAINYELEKEMEEEINKGDIGKAINKLL